MFNAFNSTSHRLFLITITITANDGVSVSIFILDVTSVIVLFIFPYLLLTRVMGWKYLYGKHVTMRRVGMVLITISTERHDWGF